jgi:N-methylhydantoinase A
VSLLLGVDTGGTFTDFVLFDGRQLRSHKLPSTPDAPERAIIQGIADLGLDDAMRKGQLAIVHGSTVATNAALEGKGARTAFITNRGFGDMLTLARQARPQLYNLTPPPLPVPVPAGLCFETGGRIAASGAMLEPLTADDVTQLLRDIEAAQPQAIAINLLFSWLDDKAERAIEEALLQSTALSQNVFISRSSFVLPEYKEYERGIATWLNAWLGPVVQGYIGRLMHHVSPAPLAIMQSSGGTIGAGQASRRAVNLLLSGPAGGLAAAQSIAAQAGYTRILTFDMGGTSTDVALIDGNIGMTSEGRIGPYPVAVPMVNLHTIGAGGGSLAHVDAGGMLHVGPQSAGAMPGPACYSRGGTQATVTDANAVLGHLPASTALGGSLCIDTAKAYAAVKNIADTLACGVETAAQGIITVANEHMTRALRVISVEKGFDPRDFTLCCFGGAGGLHLCDIADALGMTRALVPIHGGVLSALGMLVAPRQRQLSQTWCCRIDDGDAATIDACFTRLQQQAITELTAEGVAVESITLQQQVDVRYVGQSYCLTLDWHGLRGLADEFHQAHRQLYGHQLARAVEIVTLRIAARADAASITLATAQFDSAPIHEARIACSDRPVPVYRREQLPIDAVIGGPLIIAESTATTLVTEHWQVRRDQTGHLHLACNITRRK